MYLTRIPHRVSTCLAPLSVHFKSCPQGQHFRILCWLLVTLLLCQGSASLKQLTRLMPAGLRYWTVLRMVRAGYWDINLLISELSADLLHLLPPPADGTLYLIGDTTIKGKTGKHQPLAHYTRMNQYQHFTFGLSLVLVIAQWGRLRVPVGAAVLDPAKKGAQNIQFRQLLRRFQPPRWCRQIVVVADAGFASKDNLRLIQRQQWKYVFALPRTWKLSHGTHLKNLARHLPRSAYHRVASYTPDQRRKDYWVFARRAELKLLGDVTILLSRRRRNCGPQNVKLIVTRLDSPSATQILNAYARRWSVEVTFKELKSGLHLGQMQVTSEPERVIKALLLPVLAYLLLLRLYGKEVAPDKGASLLALKQRFIEETFKERLEHSDARWRRKLDQLRAAA
jgi:Transposase DDE domain